MNSLMLLVLLACNGNPTPDADDNIIQVAPDDAQMLKARETAVLMLPAFIERLTKPPKTQSYLGLKGRFEEDGHVEHLWLGGIEVQDGGFTGEIRSEPTDMKHLTVGQTVTLTTDQVSDWMAIDDGKLVGGYSVRLLIERMSPKERETFNATAGFVVE